MRCFQLNRTQAELITNLIPERQFLIQDSGIVNLTVDPRSHTLLFNLAWRPRNEILFSLLCCGIVLMAAEPDTRSPGGKPTTFLHSQPKPPRAFSEAGQGRTGTCRRGSTEGARSSGLAIAISALCTPAFDTTPGSFFRLRNPSPAPGVETTRTGKSNQPTRSGRLILFHVQPSKENTRTNLNLRSSAGHYYSLLLIEDSECKACQPDLKVFIEPTDMKIPSAQMSYSGNSEADYQKQIGTLKAKVTEAESEIGRIDAQGARRTWKRRVAAFRAEYPLTLRCSYDTKFGTGPFQVDAICTDGTFTFIKARSEQIPSLYTEKDGKPGLSQFRYVRGATAHDGTYVIDSVIYRGELRLGT